jgi:dTDP-4-amino-4,6-dideoxygalactose transaminase
MRAGEIEGAIMRMQLQRLDGILADLRRIAKRFQTELTDTRLRLAPSNDPSGDCSVFAAFQFDDPDAALRFAGAEGVCGCRPIDTGRHVYSNWDQVLQHRAGHHPAMNPFNFPQNQRLRTEYSPTMCPRTLDILGRTVYVAINPDWTDEEVDEQIAACRKGAREVL